MAEQQIRVTAKGDFTQLQRGLKQLQGDLKNVTGEVDRGARKGGFFDDSQIRALDFFGKRFKRTLQEMKDGLQEHGHAYERLLTQARQAHGAEKDMFEKELKYREKMIDGIEDQIRAMEKMHSQRRKESADFKNQPDSGGGGGGGGSGGGSGGGADSGLVSTLVGVGKFALGMAGIGGIAALAHQAYGLAKARATDSLDLSQRMRGSNGWSGTNTDMWDRASGIGMKDRMGYSTSETWGFLDAYTRKAGGIGQEQTGGLLKFGRGYGLNASEVAGMAGGNRALGGTSNPKEFADAIAGSVESSGMTPRIMEVMETNNALLQQMNTTLKDGSAQQILAYQTTLDRIGMAKGMMQLTGSQGANLIGGLGGIYGSQQGNDWKWMGIRALQQYKPKKYGKMGLFDLEASFEDGLMNGDNVPAMAKYVKSNSGGNKQTELRMFQKWMADGGSQLSKSAISDLYTATGGLSSFSEENMKKLQGGSINSGAKYDAERKNLDGQGYLSTDARFEKALETFGKPLVASIMAIKDGITTGMEKMIDSSNGSVGGILTFLEEHWKELATVAGVALVATNVLKIVAAIGMTSGGKSGAGLLAFLGSMAIPAAVVGGMVYMETDPKSQEVVRGGLTKGLDAVTTLATGKNPEQIVAEDAERDRIFKQKDPEGYRKYKRNMEYQNTHGVSIWDDVVSTFTGKTNAERHFAEEDKADAVNKKGNVAKEATTGNSKSFFASVWEEFRVGMFGGKPDTGDSEIGRFKKESVQTFTDWRKDSAKSMGTMELRNKTAMENMDRYTSMGFDRLYEEFKGFKTMVYEIFQPAADYLMGNGSGGASPSAPVGANGVPMQFSGNSFFKGWQSRVTSRFGEDRGDHKHGGLDINGEQGDMLDALAGGTVAFKHMDDGGPEDKDGKNTRAGGTEVGVRMPDGRMFFYSHLSGVNPGLKVGSKVKKGDWIGNMGGDPGKAGSGNSTTGSHLHLGYLDQGGNTLNPEQLLNGLNIGDSSIGTAKSGVRKSEIKVTFDVTGEGADAISRAKKVELEDMVRKVVTENERKRLSMQPTKMGWNL